MVTSERKQSFLINGEFIENVTSRRFVDSPVELELVVLNDLLHTANKYNFMLQSLQNYFENTVKLLFTTGIHSEFWNSDVVLEFIPNSKIGNSEFPVILDKDFTIHIDGKLVNGKFNIYNKRENKLVLLQVSDNETYFLELPITDNKIFKGILYNYEDLMSDFGEQQGVTEKDTQEVKKYKLYSYIVKNIDSVVSKISDKVQIFTSSILENFVHDFIFKHESKILRDLTYRMNLSINMNDYYSIIYKPSCKNKLVFPFEIDGNFYFIGNKTNFDQLNFNNTTGIIYLFPVMITTFTSIELQVKEVIVNIDESIIETYKPWYFGYMVHFKLYKDIKYRW